MSEAPERTPSEFRLNLEQQKKRARDLLKAAAAGEPEARRRLARAHHHDVASPRLADAQFTIARELRCPSWARLKRHIAAMDAQWAAITARRAAPDGDLTTLHLRCGHDIEGTLTEAGFGGDFHAHITPYCQGPVTEGPHRLELMARFIVDAYGCDPVPSYEEVLAAERRQEEVLARAAADYERVVIWMEHDSWDQLILMRLLAHFAGTPRPRVLELIAVNEYPGATRFIGVGQLPPEALRLLWESRRPVTPAQLSLGAATWRALASADPTTLATIAASGTPALPIVAPALHRHLRELPSITNGLSLTEELILQIVAEAGTTTLGDVFRVLQNGREPLPYLGDAGLAFIVRDMTRAAIAPLVRTEGSAGEHPFASRLTITDAGRAVVTGTRDWHELRPPARWVGGVHVRPGEPGWRWNEAERCVVRNG